MDEVLKGQLPLIENIPMDNPDGKKKKKVNALQDILIELMEDREVELTDIQKATKIPWGTLMGWYTGEVKAQLLDENILKLAQFFNVHIHYLAYGIGDDGPAFETNNN